MFNWLLLVGTDGKPDIVANNNYSLIFAILLIAAIVLGSILTIFIKLFSKKQKKDMNEKATKGAIKSLFFSKIKLKTSLKG